MTTLEVEIPLPITRDDLPPWQLHIHGKGVQATKEVPAYPEQVSVTIAARQFTGRKAQSPEGFLVTRFELWTDWGDLVSEKAFAPIRLSRHHDDVLSMTIDFNYPGEDE